MTFFNRKEEVIDIELTQYGKLLLAKGKFKPKKYAFFDDDVIYDAQYTNPTDPTSVSNPIAENQNDASTRIKESARGHAQHNYGSAYNIGEIEEGEHNVLTSVGVTNFVGVNAHVAGSDYIEFTKHYDYADLAKSLSLPQWVGWVLKDIEVGGYKLYETIYQGVESKVKIEYNFDATPDGMKALGEGGGIGARITVIKYYPSADVTTKFYPVYETNFESMEFGKSRKVFDHDIYYEGLPLGSTELQNQKLPAWDILALNQKGLKPLSLTLDLVAPLHRGNVLDDFNRKYYAYGSLPIPQISVDMKIKVLVDDSKTINRFEEDIVEVQTTIDGFTMRVKNDYLLLVIDEKNTYFENENFYIEVFEMENNTNPMAATFLVSTVGSISNGQTLKFATYDGGIYSAAVDTSVTKENSSATTIGTSGVSTNADLAESISNSIKKFNPTDVVVTLTEHPGGVYKLALDQASYIDVVTKDTALQGTLFTAGVLTSLANWSIDPSSKILKRLYFSEDSNNKESPILYKPKEIQSSATGPVSEDRVSYYMNVFVDEEIDSQLFSKYQDRLKSLRGDKLLKSQGKTRSNSINIYGEDTEDVGEIC